MGELDFRHAKTVQPRSLKLDAMALFMARRQHEHSADRSAVFEIFNYLDRTGAAPFVSSLPNHDHVDQSFARGIPEASESFLRAPFVDPVNYQQMIDLARTSSELEKDLARSLVRKKLALPATATAEEVRNRAFNVASKAD